MIYILLLCLFSLFTDEDLQYIREIEEDLVVCRCLEQEEGMTTEELKIIRRDIRDLKKDKLYLKYRMYRPKKKIKVREFTLFRGRAIQNS